jgi:hypothetical protein
LRIICRGAREDSHVAKISRPTGWVKIIRGATLKSFNLTKLAVAEVCGVLVAHPRTKI